jgi:hypothetical protein
MLRAVLLPFLEAIAHETRSQAQFETDGRTAYAREFGHPISGSGFRALLKRTIERDRGRREWHRLNLYLDNYAFHPAKKEAPACPFDHSPLADRLCFKEPLNPSLTERQNALEYSFVHFEELASARPGQRNAVKRSILDFLYSAAPSLAENAAALRRNWDRKYKLWKQNGQTPDAIRDRRALKPSGGHLAELKPDLDLIVSEAFNHDGKLALAIRKLRRAGKLSQAFTDRYTLDVRRNKSYVAKSIREEITARLTGVLEYRRSQWKVDMAGPRIARKHDYAPGDYFAADDVSWNIIFWYLDDSGVPALTRGECLVWYDCRSLYPLGYILTPGHYNGETIRRGILHIHDKHGCPHLCYLFEKGIWASRIIGGSRPGDFLSWDEYEMGLRNRGFKMELRHANTPQGKLIEGCFNIIQQSQRNLPGFVGFNEREYGQEKLQTLVGQVKRGLVHPREHFFSIEQWKAALDRSVEQYMHEPQNGKLLQGKSPAEMFADHQPLRRLPENARFLLSSHRIRTTVKPDGIGITIRGQRRFYYNEALGPWRGRTVFAWYNIEEPDLLTVSDLEMKEVITVRHFELPAFDASNEQLAEAHRVRRGFMKSARNEFDNIQHPVRKAIQRDDVLDEDAMALGNHIRRQTGQFQEDKAAHSRLENKAIRAAEEAGLPVPLKITRPADFLEGVEMETAALNRIRAKEAQEDSL